MNIARPDSRLKTLWFVLFAMLIAAQPLHGHQSEQDDDAAMHGYFPRMTRKALDQWMDAQLPPEDVARSQIVALHTQLANALHGHSAQFRELWAQGRERSEAYERWRQSLPEERVEYPTEGEWRLDIQFQWYHQKVVHEHRFESDVLRLLTSEDNRAAWGAIVRQTRRADIIRRGTDFGELIAQTVGGFEDCLDSAAGDGAQRADVRSLLSEHELVIDALLVTWEKAWRFGDMRRRAQATWPIYEEVTTSTDLFITRAKDLLSDEQSLTLQTCLDHNDFPEVFEPTPTHLLIDALRSQFDMSPDERDAVADIESRFIVDLDTINARLVRELHVAKRRTQEEWAKINEEYYPWRNKHIRNPPRDSFVVMHTPVTKILSDRFDLIAKTCRRIQSIFTEDRIAQMPPHIRFLLLWHDIK